MEHHQLDSGSRHPVLALPNAQEKGALIRTIRQAAAAVLLIAGVLCIAAAVSYFSQQQQNPLLPEQQVLDSGLPARLIIPKIAVDASFEYVELAIDGVVGAPENPENAGWFSLGPRPGEVGSAVIVGHYGWYGGKAAVFDNLYKLRIGDSVSVVNHRGEISSFVVREIQRYDPNADAAGVFTSDDGKAHLNLITCEGTWNKSQNSYSKRLVIFTDEVAAE